MSCISHFVLDSNETGLHCVDTFKMRASMESGKNWTCILRKCVSLLHCRPHNCSKMSGILRARAATESAECSALPGVASFLTTASLLDVLCYHCLNHCTLS